MAKPIHYTKNMKECPYCGSKEFYIKQSYRGICALNLRFDMKEAENTDMYANAEHTDISKYAHCSNCNEQLFPIKEYYDALV